MRIIKNLEDNSVGRELQSQVTAIFENKLSELMKCFYGTFEKAVSETLKRTNTNSKDWEIEEHTDSVGMPILKMKNKSNGKIYFEEFIEFKNDKVEVTIKNYDY